MTQIAPRMRYAPTSEQEVIVLFALLLPDLPFRLELDEVRTGFPDCLAWRVNEDGRETAVRIEFELYASHFYAHGHPCNGCDYIVCWEDDMPGDRKLPPRLPLRPLAEKASPPVIKLPLRPKCPDTIWTKELFLAACPADLRPIHEKLLTWAEDVGQVISGRGAKIPSWTFAVPLDDGSPCTLFGVYADGTIWLYRSPDLPSDRMARYTECLQWAQTLNAALASGKQTFHVGIQDEAVLPALRAAICEIRSAPVVDSR
jgi:hypothetical protein